MRAGTQRAVFAVLAMLLSLLQAGCVTTTEGGFTADKKQEIERRVEAASQYIAKGDNEQAVRHLRRALELDPDDPSIHDMLAQVFWRTGEYELAYEHFQRAISVDPKFSRTRNNYAAFLFERGDIDGAIRQLEQVTADTLYEKRADAFSNLGRAYLRKGEIAKAEEAFSRATKMGLRQGGAMLELAEIHYGRSDYKAAQRYYAQFRATSTRQTPRSLMLGIRIARASGDRDAEASYALQLKGLYPDSEEYREYQAMTPGS
jgi:type IV pilus assembly protein PilF